MRNNLFLVLLLIITIAAGVQASNNPILSHDIDLTFDIENHFLKAEDNMVAVHSGGNNFNFLINKDFEVKKVYVEGKKAKQKVIENFDWNQFGSGFEGSDSSFFSRAKMIQVTLKKKFKGLDTLRVKVLYNGTVYDTVSSASFSRVNIADQTTGIIGTEGIYLSPETLYHPWAGEGMSVFSVSTHTPADYLTVTDGKLAINEAKSTKKGDFRHMRWVGSFPADGLYLSGAVWDLREDEHNGTKVYGFFFKEDSSLSAQYVDASKQYLQMYEELFGRYPYSKFAAVENFFPTGYGMPSWTLLGQAVVRLPWIVSISLGHEVCHNWWGNGVFVDYKSGNWCEGLTTYSADYLYKERKPPYNGKNYRMTTNQDYTAYVTEENDFPLKDFRSRQETYTRAIGYGKSMMVFHMLRKYLGEEYFWSGLKKFYNDNMFKTASWKDIQTAFENVSEKNLDWYFEQWIDKPGAPELSLSNVSVSGDSGNYSMKFEVKIDGDFKLNIPIVIYYPNREETFWKELGAGTHTIELNAAEKPKGIAVDPDFDMFRILDRDEYPASLAEVFGAENQLIVLPSNAEPAILEAYRNAANSINRNKQAEVLSDVDITKEKLNNSSCLIFGNPSENSLYKLLKDSGLNNDKWITFNNSNRSFTLQGETFQGDDVSCMATVRNPLDRKQSVALFYATTPAEIEKTAVKIIHYGKYSFLAFETGRNKLKGNWDVKSSPLMFQFSDQAAAGK